MEWRLRRASEADAALLSLVANACFLDTYAALLDGADLVEHCLKKNAPEVFGGWLADPATVATVAEIAPGHAPVGYTLLTAPDFPIDPQPGDMELRRIYSLRQTYGSGLGAALMAQAVSDAVARGGKRILLGVWERNARARAFYERQGFTVIGRREFTVGRETHIDPIYARAL